VRPRVHADFARNDTIAVMRIFAKTPKKIAESVAEIKARVAKLGDKRDRAQRDLQVAQAARQRHAIEGDVDDDAARSKLQAGVDRAASVLAGLNDAIAALTAQQADAEGRVAAEKSHREREAAADSLARDIAVVEQQIKPWLRQSRKLAADLKKLGVRFDPPQIGLFIADAAGQAETALGVALADLRDAERRIRAGAEAIPRGAEPEPAPVKALPPAPTQRIFALRHISWRDPTGELRLGQRYSVCEVPTPAAVRALRSGAACAVEDERVRKLGGTWPNRPLASNCENLDDDGAVAVSADKPVPSAAAPVLHSAFTPIDRGAPYALKAPRSAS